MHKRQLNEMNLLDDFLFTTMMAYPGIDEKFCRILLKIIMNRNIEHVKIIPNDVETIYEDYTIL